ncbi:Alpha/Beta hydrolase protein [Leptodontidium sp. MPI-SDFR-AT-0119]|nr:Alpha/Beta hydrolase protein [Leptodontidium sp. MPI-SDFR-AT-0119]
MNINFKGSIVKKDAKKYEDGNSHSTTPTFLKQVYPEEGSEHAPQHEDVDIVFVHGLNPVNSLDFAFQTWTHPNGTFWPKDLLPKKIPNCRVLIFGYNSNVAFDVTQQGIKEHANTLLDRLSGNREDAPSNRPIIFIGHSLGGLVIKQALINATHNSHQYGSIKQATYSLVFFGTPHQGGNRVPLGKVAANITTAVTGSVRNDLLKSLSKDSVLTQNTNDDFRHYWDDYQVLSFYETKATRVKRLGGILGFILNTVVVDINSAKLGLGGRHETQIPIDADHSGVCKFEAADTKFEPVGRLIKKLVEEAKERSSVPGNSSKRM